MSEGLEKLEFLKNADYKVFDNFISTIGVQFEQTLRIIEQELKEGEKNKQALEIIKNKRVDIGQLMICSSLKDYNKYIFEKYRHDSEEIQERVLTKEEFDFLIEVLL